MNLEDRYKASTKNSKSNAYSGQTRLSTDHSDLNIDLKTPVKYSILGRLASSKDTSKLNLDTIPSKYAPK